MTVAARPTVPPRRGEAGFTLIEVLGAAVILAIAIAAVLSMEISALWSNRLSRNMQNGAEVAADTIEGFHRMPLGMMTSGTQPAVQVDNVTYTPTFAVLALSPTLYKLTVTVNWQDDASLLGPTPTQHTVEMQLLRTTMESF